jgi:hypothetical protein
MAQSEARIQDCHPLFEHEVVPLADQAHDFEAFDRRWGASGKSG